jgi:hypothetical protein
MSNQIDFIKIILYIIILNIFWSIIKINPYLLKYNESVRFNIYRSLMCLSFVIIAIRNIIYFFKEGTQDLFTFHHSDLTNAHDLFLAYLIFDIIKLLSEGNKRWDLYIHHIWCIFIFLLTKHYNCCGYLASLILIAECISIVSGIDSMAISDNNMEESCKYKIIRKYIIKYFRLPLWIITSLIYFKFLNKLPHKLAIISFLSSFLMIGLDMYWETKCDKIINKYNNINLFNDNRS